MGRTGTEHGLAPGVAMRVCGAAPAEARTAAGAAGYAVAAGAVAGEAETGWAGTRGAGAG